MNVEPRTETQALEQRITDALVTIRREWPALIPARPSAGIPGGVDKTATITADDHRKDGRWHVLGDGFNDVDPPTRLATLKRTAADVLNGWSRVVMEDRPVESALPDGSSPVSMCLFLERHAQWMSGHEAAHDMADEVEQIARAAKRYTTPTPPTSWKIGDCPLSVEVDGEMVTCGGSVRYREDYRDKDGEAMPKCSRCGEEAVVSWWEDRMYDHPELRRMLTYDDVAMLAHRILGRPVQRHTVKMWASRGVIKPSGERDEKGRTLFAREATVYALDLWKRQTA